MRRSKKLSAARTSGRARPSLRDSAQPAPSDPRMASATDLTDLNALDAEEVGSWTARCNIVGQESFLVQLIAAIGDQQGHVAEQLGITRSDLDEVLSGRVDLNLAEIRLLGIASESIISFQVTPARPEYVAWLASARNWARDVSVKSAHHGSSNPDPAYYGRRMVSAS